MSHINYPTDFTGQTTLFLAMKKKIDEDGADSPLLLMLAQNNIDLAKDAIDCGKAMKNNILFLEAKSNSESLLQKRNTQMKPIMKHLRGAFQFLKKLYNTNFKNLTDWGGTISISGKIKYPLGTQKRVELFMKMKAKSDSYTILPNPLLPYLTENTIDLEVDATNAAAALKKDSGAKSKKANSELYRQRRDKCFAKSLIDSNIIGAFLIRIFIDNTKALCDYGYDIVNTVKIAKERIIELKKGENRLAFRAKVGSIVSNLGTKDLNVYRGKIIAGIPLILKAGSEVILTKGYSIFSVSNPSGTDSGTFLFNPI